MIATKWPYATLFSVPWRHKPPIDEVYTATFAEQPRLVSLDTCED